MPPYPPLEDHKYQLDRHFVPSLTRPALSLNSPPLSFSVSSAHLSPFSSSPVPPAFSPLSAGRNPPKKIRSLFVRKSVSRLQFSGGNQVELKAGSSQQLGRSGDRKVCLLQRSTAPPRLDRVFPFSTIPDASSTPGGFDDDIAEDRPISEGGNNPGAAPACGTAIIMPVSQVKPGQAQPLPTPFR